MASNLVAILVQGLPRDFPPTQTLLRELLLLILLRAQAHHKVHELTEVPFAVSRNDCAVHSLVGGTVETHVHNS